MAAIDLTGQRFGKLVVLHRVGSASGGATFRVLCDCGEEKTVLGYNLRKGGTRSCGCGNGSAPKVVEPGTRVGMLTVLCIDGRLYNQIAYLCRCDCGEEKAIRGDRIRDGSVYSCGCKRRGRAA